MYKYRAPELGLIKEREGGKEDGREGGRWAGRQNASEFRNLL